MKKLAIFIVVLIILFSMTAVSRGVDTGREAYNDSSCKEQKEFTLNYEYLNKGMIICQSESIQHLFSEPGELAEFLFVEGKAKEFLSGINAKYYQGLLAPSYTCETYDEYVALGEARRIARNYFKNQ